MGDLHLYAEDIKKGMPYYIHAIKRAKQLKAYDMRVSIEGMYPKIRLFSPQAIKEFVNLEPIQIDREREDRGIGKFMPRSFMHDRSRKKFETRKRHFLQLLGINCASKYIPLILEHCDKMIQKWTEVTTVELNKELNELTFQIFTKILFGNDIDHVLNKLRPYINNENKIEELRFEDFFKKLINDYVYAYYHPLSGILPFLNDYRLVNPFKRNAVNTTTIVDCLKEAVNTSKDNESVCKALLGDSEKLSKDGVTYDEIIDDLIVFMIAGSDTSSHATTSLLYFLKKSDACGNPHIHKKVMAELADHGFLQGADNKHLFTKESIQELNYLNYFIKEGLRYDNPTFDTFGYRTYQDVEICGVPIPKNTEIRLDLYSMHYNEAEWKDPFEFIPERFDPESEYFTTPPGKARSQYSYAAFSHGVRG
mmetsp:Transcript_28546/g.32629  ORF Transcript_28546/g.32629 Transcript_28546/m.32629 type:complete len:422 (+) Transcript_28546:174-1439(+)|eukprot:CAMPEP_0168343024 /NCGR_PEP_ID=MMETSP0213-20121227/15786_1 /TAXON_ID=151035 /ORGANISM="Euplotes harpa, Strain FSP1.4" /LENGTH=421 /DNA_ID=CAMNT_0008350119 /DNA_START=165 /DNA_END=1430 /DNA_ORIENTATION=+